VHTLLLQPQGKLEVDFRLLRVDDESWLDCEMGEGEHLTRALNRFRIRVEVTIEDRSVEWGQVAVRGPHAVAAVGVALELTVPETLHAHAGWNDARVVRADWPGAPGVDIVGPLATVEAAWRALFDAGIAPAGIDAYEAVRIEAGVPRQGKDIDGATIPQEAFLERDAVSFTKGCFLGQELVCRIDTRGHVNRYLRGLRVLDAVRPPEGAEIIVGDRVVGAVTSVAQSLSLRAPVALGMVRRDVEVPSAATVRWDGAEARAEVRALPLVP
jgi:aminomethyltransferase